MWKVVVVLVSCALALAPITASASKDHNNGHHYGQLKHRQPPPPPAPNPPPNPAPNPAPTPGTGLAVPPAVTNFGGIDGAATAVLATPTAQPILLPIVIFPLPVVETPAEPVQLAGSAPAGDGQPWLLLLLLPLLAAVWIMVFARGAISALRRSRPGPAAS